MSEGIKPSFQLKTMADIMQNESSLAKIPMCRREVNLADILTARLVEYAFFFLVKKKRNQPRGGLRHNDSQAHRAGCIPGYRRADQG